MIIVGRNTRPPEPHLGAFGEKLRKQRELQGIGLDAISGTTKISTRMLRALEEEHFDQLPGGVFNKGFVRAYARHVGLNEEEAVADYLDAMRQNQLQASSLSPDFRGLPSDDPHGAVPHSRNLIGEALPGNDARKSRNQPLPAGDRRKQSRRREARRNDDRQNEARRNQSRSNQASPAGRHDDRQKEDRHRQYPHSEERRPEDLSPTPDSVTPSLATQLPWGKLAVALLLVTFALALWNSRRHREPAVSRQPAASSPQSPARVTAPAPPLPAHTLTVAKASLAKTLSSGKLSPGTISTASATNAPITLPASSSASPPASKADLTPPPQPDSTGFAPAPSANAPRANLALAEGATSSDTAAKPAGTFSLLIRAEETSWVSITLDGKPVAQETLIAPAHTSIRAAGQVVVKAGNAAGISFQLNGEDIPAQGNEGEVKTYVFDAAGFRVLPQTQSPAAIR